MQDICKKTPDGAIRVRSPRLIELLKAAGCQPVIEHRDGTATYYATSTVHQLIREYTAANEKRRTTTSATRDRNVFKARSPKLIAALSAAGCEPIAANAREVTFVRTEQVQRIIDEYMSRR